MTDDEELALAKRLPKGARRALLAMTTTPTLPGKATFNANGAFNLTWYARKHGGLAEHVTKDRRAAYFLTPLGERIKERVAASGMPLSENNADCSRPEAGSPTAESGDAQEQPLEPKD